MAKNYLDDWDEFEKHQKGGGKSSYYDYHSGGASYFSGDKGKPAYSQCYKTHPPLQLPGTDHVIDGGSCLHPAVTDADVYIGFDISMKMTERSYPWKKGAEFLFRVHDMGVPDKPEEFKKMVTWTRKQLDGGLKVHCGCIGGHGRTGMFLAAMVADAGEKDAISYVRQHYCKKAVESNEQAKFLAEHFGVKEITGYKDTSEYKSSHKATSKGGKKGGAGVQVVSSRIEKFSPMTQPFTLVKPCN